MLGYSSEGRAWTRFLTPSTLLARTTPSKFLLPTGAARSLKPPAPRTIPESWHFVTQGVGPGSRLPPPPQRHQGLLLLEDQASGWALGGNEVPSLLKGSPGTTRVPSSRYQAPNLRLSTSCNSLRMGWSRSAERRGPSPLHAGVN